MGEWDEAKHPRAHGRFAALSGAKPGDKAMIDHAGHPLDGKVVTVGAKVSGGSSRGPVSPRDAQDAVSVLGDSRAEEILGPGFLSGASQGSMRRLMDEADRARGGGSADKVKVTAEDGTEHALPASTGAMPHSEQRQDEADISERVNGPRRYMTKDDAEQGQKKVMQAAKQAGISVPAAPDDPSPWEMADHARAMRAATAQAYDDAKGLRKPIDTRWAATEAELHHRAMQRLLTPKTETKSLPWAALEVKAAGREVTPGDAASTERLNTYWAEGAGAAKIRWGVPGDFDRCVRLLGKYIHSPDVVKGHCANLHKRATGAVPGHAPGAEMADLAAKKAEHKSGLPGSLETKDAALADEPALVVYGLEDVPDIDDALDLGDGRALCWGSDGSMFVTGDEDALVEVHGPTAAGLLDPADVIEGRWDDGQDEPSGDQRRDLARQGVAMADGSYPLADADAVRRAAAGLALAGSPARQAAVRRHVLKRAKALGVTDSLPAAWGGQDGTKAAGGAGAKASEVSVGQTVTVRGKTGRVSAIKRRGPLVGLSLDGQDKPVWVPGAMTVTVKAEGKAYLPGYLPGSVEEQQEVLRTALIQAFADDDDDPDDDGTGSDSPSPSRPYVSLDGTYADHVIATVVDYSAPTTDRETYAVPYVIGDDGTVTLGEPEPCEMQVVVVPRGSSPVTRQADPDGDGDTDTGGPDDDTDVPMTRLPDLVTAVKTLGAALEVKAAAGSPLLPRIAAKLGAAHAHLCSALGDLGLSPDQADSTAPAMSPDGTPALSDDADLPGRVETKAALPQGMTRLSLDEILEGDLLLVSPRRGV